MIQAQFGGDSGRHVAEIRRTIEDVLSFKLDTNGNRAIW